jgi:cysteine synthase B
MTGMNFSEAQVKFSHAGGIEDYVGNTPLILLRRITKDLSPNVRVFAKAEWFNPGGSIKDRPSLNIIRTALADGSLNGGKRLLDSTSGNMGIAYATFGAALGVPITLTIPGNASPERISILRALGAELVLTDPLEGSDGAQMVAKKMVAEQPETYFYANQYDNPANWQAHYQTTGPELVAQTNGRISHFVVGLGTTGTLTGTGRFLKEYNAAIELVALQPDAPFHALEGLKHIPSAIKPGIFDPSQPDRTLEIGSEAAREMVRRLAHEEGLFVGVSAGAAAVGALQVASQLESGVVVTVFPDAGYKYLSDTKLWNEEQA